MMERLQKLPSLSRCDCGLVWYDLPDSLLQSEAMDRLSLSKRGHAWREYNQIFSKSKVQNDSC